MTTPLPINAIRSLFPGLLAMLLLPFLAGCEREIDIDYRDAAPQYVVEASLTPTLAKVRISQTVPVKGSHPSDRVVEGAKVVISSGDSIHHVAQYSSNGIYLYPFRTYVGTRYQLDIDVDGHHFSSVSTLQPQPVISSFRFVWKKMATTKILFADLRILDFPGQQNYYFIHFYRNNVGYRWTVLRDTSNPGKELQQLIGCMSEDSNNSDNIIREGDQLRIEVRTIDRAAYDYLYSLAQATNNGSNPVANFTGGCLGYFSAYIPYTMTVTYHKAEADEE